MQPERLTPADAPEVTRVLASAFADYPVMRYVLQTAGSGGRLERLIGFFVAARVLRDDLLLGVREPGGRLVAAALVTLPGERLPPEELAERREALWAELGVEARSRYEAFGGATAPFAITEPHHHLNMIGVHPDWAGRGFARPLLEYLHSVAGRDPGSAGVSLTTEKASNLPLYQRFGYRCLGHARVAPDLETWYFFRRAETPSSPSE